MKPRIIFTTFWEADKLLSILPPNELYSVNSVALGIPCTAKFPKLKDITRLKFFCPTWDILNKYKEDNDWDDYTKSFTALMDTRKDEVAAWFDSLSDDYRYFLCCWENTSKGAHCHRQLLYESMKKDLAISEKYHIMYRHGNKSNEST